MIINQELLVLAKPIKNMLTEKVRDHGVSHGLTEIGYDIRLKQDIKFDPIRNSIVLNSGYTFKRVYGRFIIASAIEEFQMPLDMAAIVHDKSTWARRGLSVFNTVIEPGWCGFLTLELVHHGSEELYLPAGCGIAQVVFHRVSQLAQYEGKYQNQADMPVKAILE